MKLKNKLKISFITMILMPVVLFSAAAFLILEWQSYNYKQFYGVKKKIGIESIYSNGTLISEVTNGIYQSMIERAESDPDSFSDEATLREISSELKTKLSDLVVTWNGVLLFNSTSFSKAEIEEILPDVSAPENGQICDSGFYQSDYQSIIKTLCFTDSEGNVYNVSILTSITQTVPQIRNSFTMFALAIMIVLVLTAIILSVWIYNSIIKPINKLKLATNNIKDGNFDFKMPRVSNDEIGQLCKDFEEMRLILKENSEAKLKSDMEEKDLIRNISHDLKTPLTAIKGYVEGLQDGIANTEEKRQKYIKTIANKVNDMDKLIDELSIYSRLDTNRVPYVFTKISAGDYFNDCIEEISVELEASQIDLEYHSHLTEAAYVCVDPEQLKRVVNNIISNSEKYMVEGRQGKIGIDIYDEGEYVHVQFSDNGKGIASKDLERIFERFYRTDDSRNSKQGGSGIGLAIVKKIVEDHKGKIWAESVEGQGTTMHLKLPKYRKNELTCTCEQK